MKKEAFRIMPAQGLQGTVSVPGDKSVCHRAVMLCSVADTDVIVENFAFSDDCCVTMRAFQKMSVPIQEDKDRSQLCISGRGLYGLQQPEGGMLYLGSSGTTMRILPGLLCAQGFPVVLEGDEQLLHRPMERIIAPLRMMGAALEGRFENGQEYPPLRIRPASLHAVQYRLPVASAQVKSCVLLAGLYAEGVTVFEEPLVSRDHTERMLKEFGAAITIQQERISISKSTLKPPARIVIPGDISSAAFFIVGALIVPHSELLISNVTINPTRAAFIEVLQRMGGRIQLQNKRQYCGEPVADILVASSRLKATSVTAQEVPRMIDEIPILMVAAGKAEGQTCIEGVEELKVKETDRIISMQENLAKAGVCVEVIERHGHTCLCVKKQQQAGTVRDFSSFGDHRTAMSMIIAGLADTEMSCINEVQCIKKSFPGFIDLLDTVVVR